jgi:DNA-binding response OmpR family regulator
VVILLSLSIPMVEKEGEMRNSGACVKRILVVEDEPSICQVCLRTLTAEGFEVNVADNGATAQNMLGGKNYDLCLIDIRTPVMDGQQLYQWLNEKHPELLNRVIFTTGDLVSKDTKSFIEQAGRPFLSKPFTLDELKTMVRETFRQIENE